MVVAVEMAKVKAVSVAEKKLRGDLIQALLTLAITEADALGGRNGRDYAKRVRTWRSRCSGRDGIPRRCGGWRRLSAGKSSDSAGAF